MKSGQDVYQGLRRTRAEMVQERDRWDAMVGDTRAALRGLPKAIDQAWQHLVEVAVPALTVPALDSVASRLGLPQLTPQGVAARRQADEAEQRRALAEVMREPAWIEREARKNAAQIRLAEVNDALAPLEDGIRELEAEPLFLTLVEVGYGTPAYPHRFWQLVYYHHWKHADLIVEKVGKRLGVDDFGGVVRRYREERDATEPLRALKLEQERVMSTIARLEDAKRRAEDALGKLDERALAWARGRVREHLGALPPDELTRLVHGDHALRVAGVRVLGLIAKQTYLSRMLSENLEPFGEELRQGLVDQDKQITKMARPKKWGQQIDDATFFKRTGRKRLEAWRKRRGRIDNARTRVIQFESYDRYDPVRDALWWDLMTDHCDMPFHYHHQHPWGDSAVLFGGDDGRQFAAAHAGRDVADDNTAHDLS